MIDKMYLNPRVASALIEQIHDENLPITIETGAKKCGMIQVLVECDEEYDDLLGKLLDNTINKIFG